MAGRAGARPHHAKTHEECRLESCCTCGGTVKPEPGRSKSIPVTTNIVERIKKWANPEFDPEVLSYRELLSHVAQAYMYVCLFSTSCQCTMISVPWRFRQRSTKQHFV